MKNNEKIMNGDLEIVHTSLCEKELLEIGRIILLKNSQHMLISCTRKDSVAVDFNLTLSNLKTKFFDANYLKSF